MNDQENCGLAMLRQCEFNVAPARLGVRNLVADREPIGEIRRTDCEKRSDDAQGRRRRSCCSRGIDWPVVVWIGLVHVLALVAPFYFSWQGLVACAVLIVLTGSVGVCMGYHRCLTHGSFKTYRPVRWLLAFLGGLSGEGSALTWVANHRKHHYFSDKEGDPHSPRDGAWWSHMLWFMPNFGRRWHRELVEKYAPDIMKDKMMVVIHYLFLPSHIATGVVLFLIGYFATAHRPGRLAGRAVDGVLGPGRADGVRAARDLDDQLGDAHVGLRAATKRPTTAATCGGSACWRSARVGTTTTTPINASPARATAGGKSTSRTT